MYSYSYLLVCLSDAGYSSPHACSTSLSRAGMWEVTPSSITFSSSWTKFSFFLFCVSAIVGAWRPELSVFPRAFRARGCGGERVTLLFGRARLCGPADIDTMMSVWLLERSAHSEKQRTLLLGLARTICSCKSRRLSSALRRFSGGSGVYRSPPP